MPGGDVQFTAAGISRILSDDFDLGAQARIFRLVRHFTAEGLLRTIGSVHVGSGKKRSYAQSELAFAALLLRLHRLGCSIAVMKEIVNSLRHWLKTERSDLAEAARGLSRPIVTIVIPPKSALYVRVMEWERMTNREEPPTAGDVLIVDITGFNRF
jgi:hypothetical protein